MTAIIIFSLKLSWFKCSFQCKLTQTASCPHNVHTQPYVPTYCNSNNCQQRPDNPAPLMMFDAVMDRRIIKKLQLLLKKSTHILGHHQQQIRWQWKLLETLKETFWETVEKHLSIFPSLLDQKNGLCISCQCKTFFSFSHIYLHYIMYMNQIITYQYILF